MNYRYLLLAASILLSQQAIGKEDAEAKTDDVADNAYEQKLGECMQKANAQGVAEDKLDSFLDTCLAAPASQKDEG